MGYGAKDGTGSLFNTSAVVGFGSLVQATPAFATLIGAMTSIGGSPLIASALAVTSLADVCGSGSGGMGLLRQKGFQLLKQLADKLGGVVAASRAAVDAGWIDHAYQVGQTGTTVKPKIYFACGISGAILHVAGM